MKIKKGYTLRTVAGQNIITPDSDENTAFHGALTLNNTGAFIWGALSEDTDSVEFRFTASVYEWRFRGIS